MYYVNFIALVMQILTSDSLLNFRSRLHVHSTQALFVTVAGRNMPTLTLTMAEIYSSYVDEDGFLYMNYASEEMFG